MGNCFLNIKYKPIMNKTKDPMKYHIPKKNLKLYSKIEGIKPSLKNIAPILKITINIIILCAVNNFIICLLNIKYKTIMKKTKDPMKYHILKENLKLYSKIEGIKPSLKKFATLLKIAINIKSTPIIS